MTYIKKWYLGVDTRTGQTSSILPVKKMLGDSYEFIIEAQDFDKLADIRTVFENAIKQLQQLQEARKRLK